MPEPHPAAAAVQIGQAFLRHCGGAARFAVVHSVFAAVVNLRAGGELLSLVCPAVGGASRYLTIRQADFARCRFAPGQPCRLGKNHVRVGPLRIGVAHVPLWQGALSPAARGVPCSALTAAFAGLLQGLAPGAGTHTGREPALLAQLGAAEAVPRAVRGLVGLGPGLTPAGDDMLLGYAAVYNHLGPDDAVKQALREALLENACRTSDVSAQALRDAAAGDYHEFVQDVVACLVAHNAAGLARALPRLLGVGATSGADMAAGMLAALRALL